MIHVHYNRKGFWERAYWVKVDAHYAPLARKQYRAYVRTQQDAHKYRLVLEEVLLRGKAY